MTDDPRVLQLLDEQFDLWLTPEEVCGSCPELLPEVRDRWRQMCRVRDKLNALFPPPDLETGPPEAPSGGALPQVPGYEVEALLGRGGMGIVFQARHLRLNRSVALKMELAGAYAGAAERERFQREAEAVAALQHPNIVQIYDVGDSAGRPYFTMELVAGGSLAQRLAGTSQPAHEAASLMAVLARAVQAAHQAGIMHRDLKPANVLLAADGTPKITDFGLARRLEDAAGLTQTGTAVGTPSYMAPEQAQGKASVVGPATDIYALGAILYELLTGRPPFQAETAAETMHQVIFQDPVPPSRRNTKVPRDLETICLKCLHKETRLRYVTAAALADDLDRFLRGEAIAAKPEGLLGRLARRVRRRPVLSAALAACTLLTVALIGGGLWTLSERTAATRAADTDRAAMESAANEDLRDMVRRLNQSSWPEARAALERARGRLGDRGSAELRHLLDQGTRELALVVRLEAIRLDLARDVMSLAPARPDEQYEEAFREAGLGQVGDDSEVVAGRVRESNIRNALVDALDHWSACTLTMDTHRKDWVLAVARKADPNQTTWHARARDPAIRTDQAALVQVIRTAPVADQSVSLFLALDQHLKLTSEERLPFLKRVQQAHPDDIWVNLTLGDVLISKFKPGEAIRYYQAAVSIRPGMALCHHKLGMALSGAGRKEEAVEPFRQAVNLDPTCVLSHQLLAQHLSRLCRYDEAIERLQAALLLHPNDAGLHHTLGHNLEFKGRQEEALTQYRQAVALLPKDERTQMILRNHQLELRNLMARMGRGDEARVAWRKALKAEPPQHDDWYGYAEFCLFIGQEEQYHRARQALLTMFGSSTNPYVAERIARTCLLRPGTEDELRQAIALAGRAAAVERPKGEWEYPYFLCNQALAEYRQGRFEQAIATIHGNKSRVHSPAPGLILAMSLYRSGEIAAARKTLAAAVMAHEWRANQVYSQDDWISHVLRREAEAMILPKLPAFLEGNYQPQDNDERLALLGICQFTNRTRALARLYADAFAANPQLENEAGTPHRYNAACAAALAGSGRGEDTGNLSPEERTRWRKQARIWLERDLDVWVGKLNSGREADRRLVGRALTDWLGEPDLARLREPGALEKLSADERDEWLALWKQVRALIHRATDA